MSKLIFRTIFFFFSFSLLFGVGCGPYQVSSPGQKEPGYLETEPPSGGVARGIYHTIKPKETLWRIAKTYGINLQTLAEINNIDEPAQITVGQKLFIPGATKVEKIIVDLKDTSPPPPLIKKTNDFIWPVQGRVVSRFGVQDGLLYEGIDIAAPLGTPVKAAGEGVVVYEGSLKGYGNLLIVKHENDFKTVYAYNYKNLVTVGQKVRRGDAIAKVGNNGRSPDPRLHFQIRDKDQARNPLFFLP
ncbi:MAG: LysM peptidoglycan-binding domain-containing M23 family metallopeptidase [Thermodesulfobacteriota bacterium]|jgi:murein DD-endopeptidase MepM/ murein hydrolase activator NlpD|nr:MAG: LysM peptidoglycan-binding domain-containing M23 family metallopeptidase [Thermodesulfobacteriota bacterium]